MQNPSNFQKLKEQYKLKSLELNKFKEDKEKTIKSLSDLIANNRNEINSLKEIIKKKEEDIGLQQFMNAETDGPSSSQEKNGDNEDDENIQLEEDAYPSDSPSFLNPVLKNKIKSLKNQALIFKKRFESEKENNEIFKKENDHFQGEFDRLRAEIDNSTILREKVKLLKSQLKEQNSSNLSAIQANEKDLLKKKLLIKKYEKFLYGDVALGQKGTPPSVIIKGLNTDLENRENDNQNLNQQMDFLLEENKELESRIMLLEEKDIVESAEYRPNTESRVAVTAEFSNGLGSFLVTYSDLITLVLVIFVLLYSVSKVDPEKFSEAFSSFQEQEFRYENNNTQLSKDELKMLKRVRELVKDNVDPESLVRSDVRTVLIRLKSSDLFSPGSAELIHGAEELILNSINAEMRDGVKQVHVDGHTDDVPIKENHTFPTNWELSSVRAAHVARVIINKLKFSPERMVVTGYGQYRPLKPNNNDLNRGLNRRVEIKILKDVKITEENLTITPNQNLSKKSESGQILPSPNLLPIKTSSQKP
jgi:chemotaxis protein MotB